VLLGGEMQLERVVGGQSVVLNTSSRPGTYAGGVRALAGSTDASGYRGTARTPSVEAEVRTRHSLGNDIEIRVRLDWARERGRGLS
jgi:hypothetical protein